MDIKGKIKSIGKTKSYGDNGFQKRELILTTDEQYPQHLLIEFVQDKCQVLDSYKAGQPVEIGINLRGREWTNPENEIKYFNSIQGWKIGDSELEHLDKSETPTKKRVIDINPKVHEDDLPF